MLASWYGDESGSVTATGQTFDPSGYTAAHRTLPFGMELTVCYKGCVEVVVTDRGPAAWTGNNLDLSRGAAEAIGLTSVGVATVHVSVGSQAAVKPTMSVLPDSGGPPLWMLLVAGVLLVIGGILVRRIIGR
jgi:rare lipoprotein A